MTYTVTVEPKAGFEGSAQFIGLAVMFAVPSMISAGLAVLLHHRAAALRFSVRVWLASLGGAILLPALLAFVQSRAEGDAATPLLAIARMALFDFAATMPFCLLASWLTSRWLRKRSAPDLSVFN